MGALKVIIGIVVAGGVGALGWFGYKKFLSPSSALPIDPVIPDEKKASDDKAGDDKAGDDKASPWSGGGGGVPSGDPPNVSGDPAGYSTTRFGNFAAISGTALPLGYVNSAGLDKPLPAAVVKRFQSDYNAVSRAMAAGKISQAVNLRGLVSEDGIMGKMSLRALEIAYLVSTIGEHKGPWSALVQKARS